MALDILCMPSAKTDFAFWPPGAVLTCSATVGCSEAGNNQVNSASRRLPRESLTTVGQRFEGGDHLVAVPAKSGRERRAGFRWSEGAVAGDRAQRMLQCRRRVARLTWILDEMLGHVGLSRPSRRGW